ncbi:MAG: hypothetical protein Q7K71_02420 [Candidatus Omnitrophota bacterium]|nr:hypothetical protein [Candidatus Omnitrophota bacterium]
MSQRLTIFSCPKPFKGHIEIIQRNAVQSWARLSLKPQVILIGDEKGVEEVAREFGIEYIGSIKRNAYGTPLLSSIFETAGQRSRGEFQCYVNADIILTNKIADALEQCPRFFKEFLGVVRRLEINIEKPLDFASDWERQVEGIYRENGKLQDHTAIDCFIFPKGMVDHFPDLALGRPMWDNWFIYDTQRKKIPVIDLTPVLPIYHQNHDYAHLKDNTWEGPEGDENRRLAGGYSYLYTIADSDYLLTHNGLKKNTRRHVSKFIRHLKTAYHRYIQHDAGW